MTITNTNIAALKSRLAAVVLLAFTSPALAINASGNSVGISACPGFSCDVVAVASVDADRWGGMTVTDANGRTWFLATFKDGPMAEIGAPVEWGDGHAVIAAHDRYLATLARGGAMVQRTSTDGGYHLCTSDGMVTCLYTPAE